MNPSQFCTSLSPAAPMPAPNAKVQDLSVQRRPRTAPERVRGLSRSSTPPGAVYERLYGTSERQSSNDAKRRLRRTRQQQKQVG